MAEFLPLKANWQIQKLVQQL